MSDEDDYMSDAFLQNDTKPGLMPQIFKEKYKRTEDSRKRSREKTTKPIKVQEAEKRDEKLNQAIDESNKGFEMLSRMGFKKGMGLGKQNQGRVEPIPLDLKTGRKGLGTEENEKRKKQKLEIAFAMRAKNKHFIDQKLKGDFTNRIRQKQNERQIKSDLFKSQKCCEQLDSTRELDKPLPWAWPEIEKEEKEETDESECLDDEELEEEDLSAQLHLLTDYLRTQHFYCVWCGTAYNDEKDLAENCPGRTYEDHEET